MTRTSKKVIKDVSTSDFETALSAYAQADALEESFTAQLDRELTTVRNKYAERIATQQRVKEDNFPLVQTYCEENADLFEARKSMETVHGFVGFRTNPPKLKTRKGFQWSGVLQLLKSKLPEYIRKSEEVDKQGILADKDNLPLKELGLEVLQDEIFFIDLKKEKPLSN